MLFLDYDGTLSPIVEQPDKAFMNEGMQPVLAEVRRYRLSNRLEASFMALRFCCSCVELRVQRRTVIDLLYLCAR